LEGQDLPILIAQDTDQKIYYSLNCFEDISSDIEDINNQDYKALRVAPDSTVVLVKEYMNETIVDLRLTPNFTPNLDNKFEVYYISGLFLGNKIKRRVSDIAKTPSLRSLQIVELSMAQEVQ
jgi:hypothetical protein